MSLIFFATVIPIALIYIKEDLIVDYTFEKVVKCPWTTLCPELDCEGEDYQTYDYYYDYYYY